MMGAQRFPRRPGTHHVELCHQPAALAWREQFQRGPEGALDLVDRGMAHALHRGGDQRIAAFHHQSRSPEWRYDFEHSGLAVNELLEAPLHRFVTADRLRIEGATLRLNAGDRGKPQFA
jgi:hypothetical protein